MSGWESIGTSLQNADAEGATVPLAKAMCANCNRRRLTDDLTVETNPDHVRGAYGFLVCKEPWQEGGCFQGPQECQLKPETSEDIGPIPNIYY